MISGPQTRWFLDLGQTNGRYLAPHGNNEDQEERIETGYSRHGLFVYTH